MRAAVIGAGVVGLSVAAHLAERGVDVVVLEAGGVGSGTTSTSYAWANSNGKEPRPYFDLNLAGLDAMHAQGTGSQWFVPSGHLEWAADAEHATSLRARVARLEERDYPVEWITARRAREISPALRVPDDADTIAWFPDEGYVHPVPLAVELQRRALAHGARILTRTPVTAVDDRGSGATVHAAGVDPIEVDVVVSCVGRWTDEVSELMGTRIPMVPMDVVGGAGVGFLATTAPVAVDHPALLSTTVLNARPAGGGRFLLQSTVLDATADASRTFAVDAEVALELRDRFGRLFIGGEEARIESFVVGQRAMPADGLSVIGHLDAGSRYVVATHSGVTMSLALGGWVAAEVLGERLPLLDAFRPERLLDPQLSFAAPVPRLPGQQ
jgi:glycine/D-amino acid oxidase-like deaminating enzyme